MPKTALFAFRLPHRVLRQIEEIALLEDRSRASIVRRCIQREIERAPLSERGR